MTKTVLIVEDDNFLLEMYKTYFVQAGYVVLFANDGASGYQIAIEKHPDLIILDYNMPKMDGLAVLENLRKDSWGAEVNIVMLSNFDPGEQKVKQVMADNHTYYLLKNDMDPEHLVAKTAELFS